MYHKYKDVIDQIAWENETYHCFPVEFDGDEWYVEDINPHLANLCGCMYQSGMEKAFTLVNNAIKDSEELSEEEKQKTRKVLFDD